MNPKRTALLLVSLLAPVVAWMILSEDLSDTPLGSGVVLQERPPSDPHPVVGSSSLQRLEESRSKVEAEVVPTYEVRFTARDSHPVRGHLVSTGQDEVYPFDFAGDRTHRMQVPRGRYRVLMDSMSQPYPEFFFTQEGGVEIDCIPQPERVVELQRGNLPLAGVRAWGGRDLEGPWVPLGITGQDGRLDCHDAEVDFHILLLYKESEVLSMQFLPTFFPRKDSPLLIQLEAPEGMALEVVSSVTGAGLEGAEVNVGPIPIGVTEPGGILTWKGTGQLWHCLTVHADGFGLDQPVEPKEGSQGSVFLAELTPLAGKALLALDDEGVAIPGASVFVFNSLAEETPNILWRTTTNQGGGFALPQHLELGARLVIWHDSGLLHSQLAALALETGQALMEETDPLVLEVSDAGSESPTLASCTVESFNGKPLSVHRLEGGGLAIPGVLGARRIHLQLSDGSVYQLSRMPDFHYLSALGRPDLVAAVTGEVLVVPRTGHSLEGIVVGHAEGVQEGDVLEVDLSAHSYGMETFKQWPELNGGQPTELHGWQWRNVSVTTTALVARDGSFRIEGAPAGSGLLSVRNLSHGGQVVKTDGIIRAHLPSTGIVEVPLLGWTSFDFLALAKDGGAPPTLTCLESSTGTTFDSTTTVQSVFHSNHLKGRVAARKNALVQVLALGFYPQEVRLGEQQGLEEIHLDRLPPMTLRIEDQRDYPEAVTIELSQGRHVEDSILFSPVAIDSFAVEPGTPVDFSGLFPSNDIMVSASGACKVTPKWAHFAPGGELVVTITDQ